MASEEPKGPHLEEEDLDTLSILERVGSVLSLLGCLFIIITFCMSKSFHKPINRLVFYASFGNGITNIGTLMARNYVGSPDSAGCQLQAFLIQMFMPADACWTLAMAVNVWLTFYYKFDAKKLKKMEIPYWIACYGVPFIPAITYIFLKNDKGERAYGNAVLWCWVSRPWGIWRIITFYGPVWVVILITFFIYIRTGGDIYRKRKQLRDFSSTDHDTMTGTVSDYGMSMKTTEVSITSETIDQASASKSHSNDLERQDSGVQTSRTTKAPHTEYCVTITASPRGDQQTFDPAPMRIESPPPPPPQQAQSASSERPTTAHRTVRTTIRPNTTNPSQPAARRRTYEANNAAWSYAKCALLFFTAALITWIPSSANRFYSVVHENQSLRALEYISAFVLPLQGFWNAVIYTVTSWKACKNFVSDVRNLENPGRDKVAGLVGAASAAVREQRDPNRRRARKERRGREELESGLGESDSVIELGRDWVETSPRGSR